MNKHQKIIYLFLKKAIVEEKYVSDSVENKEFWEERAKYHQKEIQNIKKYLNKYEGGVFDEYLGLGAKKANHLRRELEKHRAAFSAAYSGRKPTKEEIQEVLDKLDAKNRRHSSLHNKRTYNMNKYQKILADFLEEGIGERVLETGWEHDSKTGNDILEMSDHERVVRSKDGKKYWFENWGDFSSGFPIKSSIYPNVKGALQEQDDIQIYVNRFLIKRDSGMKKISPYKTNPNHTYKYDKENEEKSKSKNKILPDGFDGF